MNASRQADLCGAPAFHIAVYRTLCRWCAKTQLATGKVPARAHDKRQSPSSRLDAGPHEGETQPVTTGGITHA